MRASMAKCVRAYTRDDARNVSRTANESNRVKRDSVTYLSPSSLFPISSPSPRTRVPPPFASNVLRTRAHIYRNAVMQNDSRTRAVESL